MEILIIFGIYAIFLTGLNIYKFSPKCKAPELLFDIFGVVPGLVLAFMAFSISGDISIADYYTAIEIGNNHAPLHSEYRRIVEIMVIAGLLSLMLLGFFKPEKLPPLISAAAIAFMLIGMGTLFLVYIQLMKNTYGVFSFFVWLYYANLVMLMIRRMRSHIREHVALTRERDTQYRTKFGEWLGKFMTSVSNMTLLCFIMILPIACFFELLFIIFGQGPDGFIKAFTMTADWTFSTKIPPQPLPHDGHYLCTVSAGGHEKLVKPIRYGKRQGHRIIVNRQLMIANAFEDLIKDRTPKFHKAVRNFYDKNGYPISKHITTKARADIVYILMKPLEYLFLIVLYLFDRHPENRIAVQYSDCKQS